VTGITQGFGADFLSPLAGLWHAHISKVSNAVVAGLLPAIHAGQLRHRWKTPEIFLPPASRAGQILCELRSAMEFRRIAARSREISK